MKVSAEPPSVIIATPIENGGDMVEETVSHSTSTLPTSDPILILSPASESHPSQPHPSKPLPSKAHPSKLDLPVELDKNSMDRIEENKPQGVSTLPKGNIGLGLTPKVEAIQRRSFIPIVDSPE